MYKQENRYEESIKDKDYFKRQRQITVKMRAILFDWIMEVSEEFMLKRETFYIAINLVDRFLNLSRVEIPKQDL